jgi:hypothetical protein
MCLIIDNNIVHRVLVTENDEAYGDLHRKLFHPTKRTCRIVFGGELAREYARSSRLVTVLVGLVRAGRARRISDGAVDALTDTLTREGRLKSDDPHVVALALLANVRLLCSEDNNLCADFRSAQIVTKPRGNIYRDPSHSELLRRKCSQLG